MIYSYIMDFLNFDFKNTTVEYLDTIKNKIIQEEDRVYDEIASFKGELNYNNIIRPGDSIDDYCSIQSQCIGFIANFAVSEELRNHANKIGTEISKHNIELAMRKDIYDIVSTYYNGFYNTEKDYLSKEQNKSIEDTMRAYRRMGMHLPEDERKVIQEIKEKISEKENNFNNTVNNDNSKMSFKKSHLVGVPQSWFDSHKPEENQIDNEDVYEVTTKPHDYVTIVDDCECRNTRYEMYKLYSSKCYKENTPVLNEIFELRALLANKLGFNNYGDYGVQENLLNTSDKIMDFENNIIDIFKGQYEIDMNNLLAFAKQHGFENESFDTWDTRFYDKLYKKTNCDLDMEEIRKYFSLENTVGKMFDIYQSILGLSFVEIQNDNIWHESVKFYQVIDSATLEQVGYFYLDFFPREGKYSHFAIFSLSGGFDSSKNQYFDSDSVPSVGCMACNFPEGEPLKFDDVVTLFHEFGHMMHLLCCESKLSVHGAFHTKIDFVETPSQLLEYWCTAPSVLKFMTKHSETGEQISDELISKLLLSEKVNKSITYVRQIFFGIVDMTIHSYSHDEIKSIDSGEVYSSLYKKFTGFNTLPDTNGFSHFAHLFSGYQAGYYSYLRSKAYSANLYYAAFEGHEFDKEVGMRYRNIILKSGSSRNELEIMEEFLGEKLDDSYFVKELSIEDTSHKNKKRCVDEHIPIF
jgi:metallopeptidase MepB